MWENVFFACPYSFLYDFKFVATIYLQRPEIWVGLPAEGVEAWNCIRQIAQLLHRFKLCCYRKVNHFSMGCMSWHVVIRMFVIDFLQTIWNHRGRALCQRHTGPGLPWFYCFCPPLLGGQLTMFKEAAAKAAYADGYFLKGPGWQSWPKEKAQEIEGARNELEEFWARRRRELQAAKAAREASGESCKRGKRRELHQTDSVRGWFLKKAGWSGLVGHARSLHVFLEIQQDKLHHISSRFQLSIFFPIIVIFFVFH